MSQAKQSYFAGESQGVRRFFAASIMRTAISVVLLSLLPAVTIVATTSFSRYHGEIRAEEARGERFVRSMALRQEQVVAVMETLLQTLGRMADVREANAKAASALFRDLLRTSSEYSNIFLLDENGNVLASALFAESLLNFSGYDFFKKVQAQGSFSVGHVVHSPFDKNPVLHFAAPIFLENREAPGMICVALSLSAFTEKLVELSIPDDVGLYLVDGAGLLAAEHPLSGNTVIGEKWDSSLLDLVWKQTESSGRVVGLCGITSSNYVVTYKRLFLQNANSAYGTIMHIYPEQNAHS